MCQRSQRLNLNFELLVFLERGKISIQLNEIHQQMQPFLLHIYFDAKAKSKSVQF